MFSQMGSMGGDKGAQMGLIGASPLSNHPLAGGSGAGSGAGLGARGVAARRGWHGGAHAVDVQPGRSPSTAAVCRRAGRRGRRGAGWAGARRRRVGAGGGPDGAAWASGGKSGGIQDRADGAAPAPPGPGRRRGGRLVDRHHNRLPGQPGRKTRHSRGEDTGRERRVSSMAMPMHRRCCPRQGGQQFRADLR